MTVRHTLPRAAAAMTAVLVATLTLSSCSTGTADDGHDAGTTITVITSNDAPFSFTDAAGELTGIDGEMINWIAEKNDWKVKVFTTEFTTMIPALEAHKGDLIVDAMYVTDERAEKVDFTDPWYTQGEGMLVPSGSDITTRDEVKGTVVGAQTGTVFQDWIATLEPSQTKYFDSQAALIQAVANGQVDAAFTDLAVLAYGLVQNPNDKVKIVDGYEPFFPGTIAAAVSKGDAELEKKVNEGLRELQESPEYVKILEKYGLSEANTVQK